MRVKRRHLPPHHLVLEDEKRAPGFLGAGLDRQQAASPELPSLAFVRIADYWDGGAHSTSSPAVRAVARGTLSTNMARTVPYEKTGRVGQKARTRAALIAATRELLAAGSSRRWRGPPTRQPFRGRRPTDTSPRCTTCSRPPIRISKRRACSETTRQRIRSSGSRLSPLTRRAASSNTNPRCGQCCGSRSTPRARQ